MAALSSVSGAVDVLATSGTTTPKMSFKPVLGPGREDRLAVVRTFFRTVLEPIYGSKEGALKQIESDDSDHTCRLLYADDVPVGIIVFKKALSNEYSPYGVTKSCEINTLAVLDPKKFSGKGYGSMLLNKAIEAAKDLRGKCMHVTVSSTATDSLDFFRKKHFHIIHTFNSLVKAGMKEHLLFRKHVDETEAKSAAAAIKAKAEETTERYGTKRKAPELAAEPSPEKKPRKDDPQSNGAATASADPGALVGVGAVALGMTSGVSSSLPAGATAESSHRPARPSYDAPDRPSYDPYERRERESYATGREASARPVFDPRTPYQGSAAAGSRAPYAAARPARPLEVTLRKVYLDMIKEGIKTVEGRINSGMFSSLRIGSTIRFFYTSGGGGDEVICQVTQINRYRSFTEMLTKEGFKPCLPDAHTLAGAITTYHNIPSFKERAERSGVLAIHIKKL